MIHLYAGFDPREEIGYHAFTSSVIHNASAPVSITPLHLPMFRQFYNGGQRDGTNAFIYSRFLIPYLQSWRGWAVFMDGSDMICRGDIAELWAMRDPYKAVQVVKHNYKTKHPRKYVGTSMEADNADYPAKNWSSMMLLNCAHYDWRRITPSNVETMSGQYLHRFSFTEDRFIGELPAVWNWLPQEFGPNPDAKLLHFSVGIPAFNAYCNTDMKEDWYASRVNVNHATR